MEMGVAVLATTEVIKQWAETAKPKAADLSIVLEAIERFANYRPGRGAENYGWWLASIQAK
jgi:hypothetical protein